MFTLYMHGVHAYNFNGYYQNKILKMKLSTCLNEIVP